MDYPKIVQGILDIGEEMLKCGAENFRLDDSLYRMCDSYGFKRYDVFVIPSNIQITVETPDGEIITQIRHIESSTFDYDKLDYLNDLSRYVCRNQPDADEINRRLQEVMNRKGLSTPLKLLAAGMSGAGFSILFGAGIKDALIAVVAAAIIVLVGDIVSKREHNVLVYNAILAFLTECFVLAVYSAELATYPDRITISIVMLLISGLGVTNGIREILQRDFISGFLNLTNAFLGALGIACGVAVSMVLFNYVSNQSTVLASGIALQLVSCTFGCIGFAMWFNIKGTQVAWSGVGAFFTWLIYALAVAYLHLNHFSSVMVASIFVAMFAVVMARINKAPSTIFLSASAFPLIPGANLYYILYGFVSADYMMVRSQALRMFGTCLAIAVGFIIVDVIVRNLFYAQDETKQYNQRKSH